MAHLAKWEICPECDGHGKSSAYLGAFSMEDLAEQGDDFQEDYFAGAYDRPCQRCRGAGKIDVNGEREANRIELENDPAWQSERWLREIGA